ncbi:hypothetical protein SAMN05444164_3742 [Bradyrhizobium erythrophlei]|uniref:Collagen triple helix repeat-containing protein n=1 Tax=Bradyrhizobium erythrophlei TaxID=1437360 RepID=A0A1H4Y112_9BRAD|nr:hypothetical protein SAMN05444164_3742 [Bradyrhizobium erythrophlei]
MARSLLLLIAVYSAVSLSGCGGTPVTGEKGDKGDAGAAGAPGQQGQPGPPRLPGKDGKDAVVPPQFRVVRSSNDGGVTNRPLCGVDEVMVSATCVASAGSLTQAPTTTLGTTGASSGQSAGQTDAPLAVILCAKR